MLLADIRAIIREEVSWLTRPEDREFYPAVDLAVYISRKMAAEDFTMKFTMNHSEFHKV